MLYSYSLYPCFDLLLCLSLLFTLGFTRYKNKNKSKGKPLLVGDGGKMGEILERMKL